MAKKITTIDSRSLRDLSALLRTSRDPSRPAPSRRKYPIMSASGGITNVGNTGGYLVAGINSSGVATVWDLNGEQVWSATIMPYNTPSINPDMVFFGDDLVTISYDNQHLTTANNQGVVTADIAIGDPFWTGSVTWPGRLAKNSNGVAYLSTDGTTGGRMGVCGSGDLASNSGERTSPTYIHATESYIAAWSHSTTGGSGLAHSALYSADGTYISKLNIGSSSKWSGSNLMGGIDRVTNTAWFIGINNAGTGMDTVKTVLSTNVTSNDASGLTLTTLTFCWIPPWGGRMYWNSGTSLANRALGSGATTQEPQIVTPGGTIYKMDGGWVNGRKYAVIAAGSGLSLCDSGGVVWTKAGGYVGCAFRGQVLPY